MIDKPSGPYLLARYEIARSRGLSLEEAGKILDKLLAEAKDTETGQWDT